MLLASSLLQDLVNDFSCACVVGFTGNTCQTNINDCFPYPCENGGTCVVSDMYAAGVSRGFA